MTKPTKNRALPLRLLVPALAIALPACQAAEAPAPTQAERPWSLSLMTGALRIPDFEGSRSSHNQFAIGFDASYRTESFGTFSAGLKGLNWAPIATDTLKAGIALDGDYG